MTTRGQATHRETPRERNEAWRTPDIDTRMKLERNSLTPSIGASQVSLFSIASSVAEIADVGRERERERKRKRKKSKERDEPESTLATVGDFAVKRKRNNQLLFSGLRRLIVAVDGTGMAIFFPAESARDRF